MFVCVDELEKKKKICLFTIVRESSPAGHLTRLEGRLPDFGKPNANLANKTVIFGFARLVNADDLRQYV